MSSDKQSIVHELYCTAAAAAALLRLLFSHVPFPFRLPCSALICSCVNVALAVFANDLIPPINDGLIERAMQEDERLSVTNKNVEVPA